MSEARKLLSNPQSYEEILLESIGSIPIPSSELQVQLKRYDSKGLMKDDFFLHFFTSVHWLNEKKRTYIYNMTRPFFDFSTAIILTPLVVISGVGIR